MRLKFLTVILCGLLLSACTIHTIDIQQGNVIDKEGLDQLAIGMTKRQVRFILGTPLLQDPFHINRWDYIYTLQPGNTREITKRQRVTIYFENETLVKIDRQL
ncbi:MAG: outer membrane protein assembly factor BamE [Gammaproteobacteria bacterium]|nr:outer membrane protein assembly factor BamE [Gammaproteobacteria bacterium]